MHYVKQDGHAVFKFAVRKSGEICRRLLDRHGVNPDSLDLFVSHQANRRIIEAAAERLGLPSDKVVINLEKYGNTTAATIPLALADAVRDGRLKRDNLVLLASVGAGFTSARCSSAGASNRQDAEERILDGRWQMADGGWRMANGRWQRASAG